MITGESTQRFNAELLLNRKLFSPSSLVNELRVQIFGRVDMKISNTLVTPEVGIGPFPDLVAGYFNVRFRLVLTPRNFRHLTATERLAEVYSFVAASHSNAFTLHFDQFKLERLRTISDPARDLSNAINRQVTKVFDKPLAYTFTFALSGGSLACPPRVRCS